MVESQERDILRYLREENRVKGAEIRSGRKHILAQEAPESIPTPNTPIQ
jgi:hypothetical protein